VEAVAIRPGDAKSRAAARAEWPVAQDLAASGWRDTTRLAHGDPAMGAAIAVTNAAELGARLRDLRGVLDAWQAELDRPDGPDEKGATARLAAAKTILEKSKK
jgi:prephenate dehydrogenase